jgi:hypothetical protein
MVTFCTLATVVVVTLKVPVVNPTAMVMLAGTVAAALLLERVTRTPSAGAGETSVTVPVADCPPVTVTGKTLRL